jgi:alpha-mannosidase
MLISAVESTDLFAGTQDQPLQIVRVRLASTGPAAGPQPGSPVTLQVTGRGIGTPMPVTRPAPAAGGELAAEVAVDIAPAVAPGTQLLVLATASWAGGSVELAATITAAEPGWTMWMISHFHYDPVWWSTQGQFLESRLLLPDDKGEMPEVRTAFELVTLHLDAARHDPDYKFVLAELDYLKPHFDAHPDDRADLLGFIKAGRIELVGGTYNEPNTNLTGAESTIRNAVYGIAYQRDVLGGDPRTSWMLDAFGFDPGFPGIMAAAGLTSSSWARGPFHQWGPGRSAGDNKLMQFASEFEWLSPDGTGLLTSYMANHYSAGWAAAYHAKDLAKAEADAYEQFRQLAPVAATRNVLLPVGGDHVVPARWATAIHRDWNARYTWPRFVTAVPAEFFAAVRAEADDRGIWITPQTRDMNPLYTGKDVSYTDTKQGQRAAEVAVLDGERLGTLTWLAGANYPAASLDKAWRQLVFGAHHDAITGSEGDQVYLDLLGGWREAWERGHDARTAAVSYLAQLADTASLTGTGPAAPDGTFAIVVVNSLSLSRAAMARVSLQLPPDWPGWLQLRDDEGAEVPFLAEGVTRGADGTLRELTITFRAQVPGVGFRSYLARPSAGDPAAAGWQPVTGGGFGIENDAFAVESDPARGGTLSRVLDKRSGAGLLQAGGRGNELLLQPEHPKHPRWAEGPWLLCPAGPGTGSATVPARVRAESCPAGRRLVTEFRLGDLRVTQETVLWDGADRVEFRTHVDGSIGQDHLLRVMFPVSVPGGLPVYQTAVSVIGRPPGPVDSDVAEHSYTLDSPANEWLAVGSAAAVAVPGPDGSRQLQAIGVAEVVAPDTLRAAVRQLIAALAGQGVTATCSLPEAPRYGYSELDSNLPDFRICVGGPEQNALTAQVLAAAGPATAAAVTARLAAGDQRVWLPATRSRADAFAAGTDVRGPLDLPVLIVAASELAAAVGELAADLADAVIEVPYAAEARGPAAAGGPATALSGQTVALLNRGTPSGLVTPDGVLTMALMRACSTWPCGVWIDGEKKRTTPDGSSFAWQHWSHTFEYALTAGTGDWRSAGFATAGQDYNHDLLTVAAGLHPGPLPPAALLAGVDPAGALLSTLKPRGNPLAPAGQPDLAAGLTARLRDLGGRGPATARLRLFTGIAGAALDGICEDSPGEALPVRDQAAEVLVPQAGLVTMTISPDPAGLARLPGAGQPAGADHTGTPEPAQPVYSRYWLHGKGPAPAGNLPVAVHLSPAATSLDDPRPATVRLTVACGPAATSGLIRLDPPAGFGLQPAGPLAYDLPPLGHQAFDLMVTPPSGAAPGRYFLTAQIDDPAGQVIEDSALLTIGQPPEPRLDLPLEEVVAMQQAAEAARAGEAEVSLTATVIDVTPGGEADVEARLRNLAGSAIRGEAQLISPYGSWHQVRPWTTGFAVAAGETGTLRFRVAAPATARPGENWWALVKVMYFGRLIYTEPVEVRVIQAAR